MRWRNALDKTTAVVLSLLVHLMFAGLLFMSLEWTPMPLASQPSADPVKAVVMDEDKVIAELEKLKQEEAEKKALEQERIKKLETEAEKARKNRLEEEQRLAELQKRLNEEKVTHEKTLREKQKEEAERIAKLKRTQQEEQERLNRLEQQKKKLAQEKDQERLQLEKLAEKKREEEKRKQEAEAERTRLEAERKQAEEATRRAEEEKRRIEEQTRIAREAKKVAEEERRKAELARQKAEAERKRAEAEQKRAEAEQQRKEEEALLLAQMREEQVALDSARRTLLDQQQLEYIAQIQSAVENKWIRPASLSKELNTEVLVSQIPGGEVIRVTVTESSGNVAFDRSVVNAIWKASPLPLPKDPALFTRNLQFVFDPEN